MSWRVAFAARGEMAGSALAATISTGAVLLRSIRPARFVRRQDAALTLCLAVTLGFAVHSVAYYVWLTALGARRSLSGLIALDAALPIGLAALLFVRNRWTHRADPLDAVSERRSRPLVAAIVAEIALVISVVSAYVALRTIVSAQPHGGWDAWAIWNLKARWLAVGEGIWDRVITSSAFVLAPLDYPLFLPLTVARFWAFTGNTSAAIPQWPLWQPCSSSCCCSPVCDRCVVQSPVPRRPPPCFLSHDF